MQVLAPELTLVASAGNRYLMRYAGTGMLANAAGDVAHSFSFLDHMKFMKSVFKEVAHPSAEDRKLFERAIGQNIISIMPEELSSASGRGLGSVLDALKSGNIPKFLWEGSAFSIGATERAIRLLSFQTGLKAGRELLGYENVDDLFQFAKEFTSRVNFRYGAADKSTLFSGPVGSLAGQFKTWNLHYWGNIADYVGEGVKFGNWKPLLYASVLPSTVAGVGTMPVISPILDTAFRIFGNKTLMQQTYDTFNADGDHERFSDAIYYGLPGVLGISLKNQAENAFTDPMRDMTMMWNMVLTDRMARLGGAVSDAVDQAQATGNWQRAVSDPRVADKFIRALAPVTVYRTVSTLSEDDTLKSLNTGYPTTGKMSVADKILYSMGFNSTQVDKQMAASQEMWADQDRRLGTIQAYGEAWAEAEQRGDTTTIYDIRRRAILQGLPLDSILRSAQARLHKYREPSVQRQFSPQEVFKWKSVLGR